MHFRLYDVFCIGSCSFVISSIYKHGHMFDVEQAALVPHNVDRF